MSRLVGRAGRVSGFLKLTSIGEWKGAHPALSSPVVTITHCDFKMLSNAPL